MKRLFCIIFAIALLLTSCTPSPSPTPPDPIPTTETAPLEYKMALLGRAASPSPGPAGFPDFYPTKGDMSEEFFYSITFAVEVPAGCQVDSWSVTDAAGNDLLGGQSGLVAMKWDAWVPMGEAEKQDSITQAIFQVTSLQPLNTNDFVVTAASGTTETVLSFNAQAEELSIDPANGQGAYLIERDGQYYRRVPDTPEETGFVNITNPFAQ